MKDKDVYQWHYTSKKAAKLQESTSSLYHCKSNIAIYNGSRDLLIDTYWHGFSDNSTFNAKQIENDLSLDFIANLNDLVPCRKAQANYYKDEDFVNLSHPNNTTSDVYYIRKGAEKCLDKMKIVLRKHIEHYDHKAEYAKVQADRIREDLVTLTLDSWVPCDPDVCI